jgi:serine phosphatase RsbU (regulator of sigma subunit)
LPAARPGSLSLLLVEDDAGDAYLVEELLAEAGTEVRIRWARSVAQAAGMLAPDIDCVLLDLGLPDADGLDGLRTLLAAAPHTAVLVLTGMADAHRGAAAVACGAQDYLVKHEIDGSLLTRSIQYAVERKRADESQRRLVESELRGQENARLERGLLPVPLLEGSGLAFASRYRPGRSRALLGGDFYDAVRSRTNGGTVHVMIGDVCGHGPDEAALGVLLRIAWRTLVLAGLTGNELLRTLQEVLEHERDTEEIFATLCMLEIAPDGRTAGLHLAGHPAPVAILPGRDGTPRLLPAEGAGPALGLVPGVGDWPRIDVDLGECWQLLLYTDGLIEGRIGMGSARLGEDGMIGLLEQHLRAGRGSYRLIDATLADVERLNGDALTDDVAVLLLARDAG